MKGKFFQYRILFLLGFFLAVFTIQVKAAETYYTANSIEEFKSIVIEKMKEGETPIRVHYTGKEQMVGPNSAYNIINNELKTNTSLAYLNETINFGGSMEWNEKADDYLNYFHFDYQETKAETDYVYENAKKIINDIIKPKMSTDQKVRAINQYVVDHVEYNDYFSPSNYIAYGTLKTGMAVCEGYTLLTQALFDTAGIPSYIVGGELASGGAHTWNFVNVDGTWRHVDTTWNDGFDPSWNRDLPYIDETNNEMIARGRIWDWENYPLTADSPKPKSVNTSRAEPLTVEKVFTNNIIDGELDRTYLRLKGVEPGDTIVLYDKDMNYLRTEVIQYWLLEPGGTTYDLEISSLFNYNYDLAGEFYITRTTELRTESEPFYYRYDLRPETKPISAGTIHVTNNDGKDDTIKIDSPFDDFGEIFLYDERKKLIEQKRVYGSDVTFSFKELLKYGKNLYLSVQLDGHRESSKTAVSISVQEPIELFTVKTNKEAALWTSSANNKKYVGKTKKGQNFQVFQSVDGFYKVKNGKSFSYIYYKNTNRTTEKTLYNVVTSKEAPLWTNPSSSKKFIKTIEKGTKLEVVQSSKGFYKVRYGKGYAYIYNKNARRD